MRPRSGIVPSIFLAVALTLGACGTDREPAPGDPDQLDLVGRTFLSDDVTVNDKPYPLAKGSQLRLTFEDGSVGGSAGCNSMGGDASWDNGVMLVKGDSMMMTEMGCAEPLMQQDTWFSDILTSEPRLSQADTTLTLTSGDTVIIFTDEEVVVPDGSLTGTTWTLDSIISGDTASSNADVKSTLEFSDEGQLNGAFGCNGGGGAYTIEGDVISFGPLATTAMACEPPASEVEEAVLGVLQGDVTYSIDGESLVLSAQKVTGSGATALVYRSS